MGFKTILEMSMIKNKRVLTEHTENTEIDLKTVKGSRRGAETLSFKKASILTKAIQVCFIFQFTLSHPSAPLRLCARNPQKNLQLTSPITFPLCTLRVLCETIFYQITLPFTHRASTPLRENHFIFIQS